MQRSFTAVAAAIALSVAAGACASLPAQPDAPSSAWSLGPAMPRPALAPGVALLGQQVVVVGGFTSDAAGAVVPTTLVNAFDVASETWGRLPDAPVAWTDLNLAVIGATLYIAGGLDGATQAPRGDSYALDALDGQWKALAAMPAGDERGGAGVVAAPGHITLLGGQGAGGAALASCLDYDIIANQWTRLPDLPVARSHPAAMRETDGTLVVAGGFAGPDAAMPLGDVWALSPPGVTTRTWTQRTGPPAADPARGDCAYGVVLSQLVCAGGQAAASADATVASYDPYLDVWTDREAMPVARTQTQGAASTGRLFVPGGSASATAEAANQPTDTLYIYTPLDTAH